MGAELANRGRRPQRCRSGLLEYKSAQDWATPGRAAWMEWLDSPSAAPEEQDEKEMSRPMQAGYRSNFVRLDAEDDHETAKAVHFDGCSYKDEHCHSGRCECWGAGYWVPKSKLFFDEEERQWYIDRFFAEDHDILVSEDEYKN